MRRIYRYLSSLFLVAALAAPLVSTGCAVRFHDRYDRHEEEEEREHQQYRHDDYRDFYQLNFIGTSNHGDSRPSQTDYR